MFSHNIQSTIIQQKPVVQGFFLPWGDASSMVGGAVPLAGFWELWLCETLIGSYLCMQKYINIYVYVCVYAHVYVYVHGYVQV